MQYEDVLTRKVRTVERLALKAQWGPLREAFDVWSRLSRLLAVPPPCPPTGSCGGDFSASKRKVRELTLTGTLRPPGPACRGEHLGDFPPYGSYGQSGLPGRVRSVRL